MNINILKRALEELSKETPRLDYLRGMLETLIEMTHEAAPATAVTASRDHAKLPPEGDTKNISQPIDEATLLEERTKALMPKLKADAERMNQ